MFIRGHQRSSGHHGSSRTVSARREANRLYPKRPTGRGRSRRRLVRALDRSRVPPPRTYRPMTSPIRRYRPIRRCTLHRCGRIDGDASPPPDEGGNHLMSETHLMRDVIRSDASLPPPPAHPSSELIRGHQRSSAVIRGIPSTSSCSSVIRAHQRSSRSSAVIRGINPPPPAHPSSAEPRPQASACRPVRHPGCCCCCCCRRRRQRRRPTRRSTRRRCQRSRTSCRRRPARRLTSLEGGGLRGARARAREM